MGIKPLHVKRKSFFVVCWLCAVQLHLRLKAACGSVSSVISSLNLFVQRDCLKMSSFIAVVVSAFAIFLIASTENDGSSSMLRDKSHVQDKDHLGSHLQGIADLDSMTDNELQFHYFKAHDLEGNNKLDGCELVKALLHFHAEESHSVGHRPTKIFTDAELEFMIDPILKMDDKNLDGFIDYSEFVAAQKSRGF
ncbi:multiple coagulation factor deficiency protein 2 homolog [Stegodyphus dumicola]|uniref:multiple coagulation factor deficiency protein 2 homolog n=1 Tax=Stegodyphus dumicola TaxID=202533 RepID=UPI0015B0510F|nr:multiple coagulation factor deficiency protein 2 homolog [Stegodyphus dumicola]